MITNLKPYNNNNFLIILLLSFLWLLSAFPILAQANDLNFAVDFAQFKLTGNAAVVEIYYSLSRQGLTYQKIADGFLAEGVINTYLMSPIVEMNSMNMQDPDTLQLWQEEHFKIISLDSIIIHDVVDSLFFNDANSEITEMMVAKVKEGEFDLLSIFTDLTSKKKKSIIQPMMIRKFSKKKLAISSVQLARALNSPLGEKSKFDKGGIRVIPNATRGYKLGNKGVPFYVEMYNLNVEEKAMNSKWRLEYFISNRYGVIISSFLNSYAKKADGDGVLTGFVSTQNYPCGFYHLKIKVTDEFNGNSAEAENNFYVHD